ncbi:MerR family transcriptional regulator [Actinoplanes sp. SE50]|uniref:MerR family transcriptional regulator n=1 Tax=unclassified Actinoplanes TaxID=2626549 RepID=UPI00023ECADB|nr:MULTISPECIES: MerR family transcriptional regulator [unclassified Actinoplanes]AEV83182.1 HTH-type transcriptional regulator hmrR [Actinoplanes sp. SE50/110]ATO81577.1 MerR family transcriptional regulator [Actinoplanes sp. SE50]SLL98985.1 MerR Family Transcriptional Regulator [Actinoplanes sp. SE50/110]
MLEVKPGPTPESTSSIPTVGVTIAEAARRTGISVHTLRYYERAGLMVAAIDRTAAGRRRYRQFDLDWITACTKLRATGMPIKTIRRYAELVSSGHGNEQERLAVLEAHRAEVVARLAEVQESLTLINHKIDVYRGRLTAGVAEGLWASHPAQAGVDLVERG